MFFENFFKHEDAFFSLFHLSIQASGVTVAQGYSEKKRGGGGYKIQRY